MTASLTPSDLSLLDALLRARGKPVALDFLTQECGASAKEIGGGETRLTRLGCVIESDMHHLRLIQAGLGVWVDYLQDALPDRSRREVEVYQTTASTQDTVRARAGEPLLVLADEQTGGRGRLGRRWLAPPGTGLLFSMTHDLSPDRPDTIDRISFLTAVAIAQSIERITDRGPIQIRWPNDIYVDHKKLAGILVETVRPAGASHATAIIGVGINVGLTENHLNTLPAELRPRVTSFALRDWSADRLLIAEKVIAQIDRHLHGPNVSLLVDEWRARNLFREQTLRLSSNGKTITGTVIDLDPDHGLIIRRDTGEITHLPAATTTVL
jgi:BirA family transcriptional regulator, biotin operon repressor / biotin---[acetyl-CoA-carboxylase] ligase